jgi:hypothetical protein
MFSIHKKKNSQHKIITKILCTDDISTTTPKSIIPQQRNSSCSSNPKNIYITRRISSDGKNLTARKNSNSSDGKFVTDCDGKFVTDCDGKFVTGCDSSDGKFVTECDKCDSSDCKFVTESHKNDTKQ